MVLMFVFFSFPFRDLEKAVEDLSELLESPIEAEAIPTLRQKVTDKTVCTSHAECVRCVFKAYIGLCSETKRNRSRGYS